LTPRCGTVSSPPRLRSQAWPSKPATTPRSVKIPAIRAPIRAPYKVAWAAFILRTAYAKTRALHAQAGVLPHPCPPWPSRAIVGAPKGPRAPGAAPTAPPKYYYEACEREIDDRRNRDESAWEHLHMFYTCYIEWLDKQNAPSQPYTRKTNKRLP
jgi:hypothetical protein